MYWTTPEGNRTGWTERTGETRGPGHEGTRGVRTTETGMVERGEVT